jgi:3-phenylpropionate/trans-cinnamate dioxygenase ferredoxin component
VSGATLIDVAALDDLTPGEPVRVDVGGRAVCLVNVDGTIAAVHDVCTHALESLSDGYVDGDRIECPRHGAAFSLLTGAALTPPATKPLPIFGVQVRDGRVLVDAEPSLPHPILDR